MNYGSLFTGAGGGDIALDRAGMECRWQCEMDKHCNSVLARHWPDKKRYDNITTMKKPEKVDVIIGGFPCQDLSVAGKREGLSGKRSGLFWEFMRIISEVNPDWVIIENVPGLLSSQSGDDIKTVMDEVERLGYISDIDIFDSRYFGVPQRRRRVFITCQSVKSFHRKKTITSAITICKCVAEMLQIILALHSDRSKGEHLDSGSSNLLVDGLKRRMKLFDLDGKKDVYVNWLTNWEDDCAKLAREPKQSVSESRGKGGSTRKRMKTGTVTSSVTSREMKKGNAAPFQFTDQSWKNLWEEFCKVANAFTTSTGLSKTTEKQIFSFSQTLLRIALLTFRLKDFFPNCSIDESFVSTAIEEFTSYARLTSESLFGDMEWIQPWRDFIRQAERIQCGIGINSGTDRCRQILSFGQGLSRNPAKVQEAGKDVAGTLAPCLRGSGCGSERVGDSRGQDCVVPVVAGTLNGNGKAAGSATQQDAESGLLISHTLRAEGFDASEDGTGRGTPLVTCFDARQNNVSVYGNQTSPLDVNGYTHAIAFQCQGSNVGPMGTIRSGNGNSSGGVPFMAFAQNTRDEVRDLKGISGCLAAQPGMKQQTYVAFSSKDHGADAGELSPTLRAMGHTGSHANAGGQVAVSGRQGVRRLTPRECERLQGWPDDHTRYDANGKEIADGPRYRMIGNGMTSNVIQWIGTRIIEVESK